MLIILAIIVFSLVAGSYSVSYACEINDPWYLKLVFFVITACIWPVLLPLHIGKILGQLVRVWAP